MDPFKASNLPPANIPWERLVPAIGKANRALAKYDGILMAMQNPALLLAPLTTQEAVLSSAIEGTQATLGEVMQYEADAEATIESEARRQDIKEVLNYRKAMAQAVAEMRSRPFSLNLMKTMHATLLASVRGRTKVPGHFRKAQNFIGAPGSPIEAAYFVPPPPDQILPLLDNWEKYWHDDAPDPLVQLALLHAQFEIVHPFMDGNGRLGRIFVPLFLYEKRLLSKPMFYLSAYLDTNRGEYVSRLRALDGTPGKWGSWLSFFLIAVWKQAEKNTDKAAAILELYEELKAQVMELTNSKYAVPLVDKMFAQPIFTSSNIIQDRKMPSKQMVMTLLRKLRVAGLLSEVRKASGPTPSIFALARLVNLCEGREVIGPKPKKK